MTDLIVTALAAEPGNGVDGGVAKYLGESILTDEDLVNNPGHYADGPVPGIECIEVTRWFNFACGNAIKYIWRHDYKGNPLQDLKKARWYLDDEIARLESPRPTDRVIDTSGHPGLSG